MVGAGVVTQTRPWHPWYQTNTSSSPAGYATSYSNGFQVSARLEDDTSCLKSALMAASSFLVFSRQFVTLRLAGHQVPKNVPGSALTMITAFLDGAAL